MVTAGIDPHEQVHVAVAVDDQGRRIGRPLTVKNDAVLMAVLLKWIRSITEGRPVTRAIEDGRGFARRLADGLLLSGFEVVWVPARLMADRLVRDYFPTGVTDFTTVEQEELSEVQEVLNTRPRKTLGHRAPAEDRNDFLVFLVATTGSCPLEWWNIRPPPSERCDRHSAIGGPAPVRAPSPPLISGNSG